MKSNDLSLVLVVLGSIASFASGLVVLTVIIFPSMIKRKLFVHTIVFISLSDMIANFVLAWGFPTSEAACACQAALLNFFLRASWCWTVFLSLNLHNIVMSGYPFLSLKQMHAICWGMNLLMELLPLTTQAHYGEDDNRDGNTVCYIANGDNKQASRAWEMVTFSLPLIVSMSILFFCNIRICLKYRDQDTRVLNKFPTINSVVGMLWMYPVCMILTWFPHLVISVLFNFGIDLPPLAVDPGLLITFGWGSLYGVCLAVIFFVKGSEARRRWNELLCGGGSLKVPIIDNSDNPMPNVASGYDSDDEGAVEDFYADLDDRGNISRNQSYVSIFEAAKPLIPHQHFTNDDGSTSEHGGSIQNASVLTQATTINLHNI
jgi:hypothetical protein